MINEVCMIFRGPTCKDSYHAIKVHARDLPLQQEVLTITQSQGNGKEPRIMGEDLVFYERKAK